MSFQPFSRLCVQRLTQLLELDCLEGFQELEDCPYVAQNIQIEDKLPYNNIELKNTASCTTKKSPRSQIKRIFKDISKKGNLFFMHYLKNNILLYIILLFFYMLYYYYIILFQYIFMTG